MHKKYVILLTLTIIALISLGYANWYQSKIDKVNDNLASILVTSLTDTYINFFSANSDSLPTGTENNLTSCIKLLNTMNVLSESNLNNNHSYFNNSKKYILQLNTCVQKFSLLTSANKKSIKKNLDLVLSDIRCSNNTMIELLKILDNHSVELESSLDIK